MAGHDVNVIRTDRIEIEEILDAHLDTVELLLDRELGYESLAHLEYLRALYRHGQALLARSDS